MKEAGTIPEFECFDVGIVRCVGMYRQTGMYSGPLEYNFVMGVASGMPADPELLPILLKLKAPDAHWQVTAIGRAEIWPLHQRCADLGGHLRSGLEDTFYLGDGTKVNSNGQLVEALAKCARNAGREIASPAEARQIFGDQALAIDAAMSPQARHLSPCGRGRIASIDAIRVRGYALTIDRNLSPQPSPTGGEGAHRRC